MTAIRILPEILSNQIAAGEVVQRPANAVKELVENSIDAKARMIVVEIEKGGRSLIRISDDGIGMSRDDALLSIERYATSKLLKESDLFSIATMGFRGEALPSIASVSKFTMVTKRDGDDVATRIDINGGRLQNVADAGAPVGTMIDVRHLFYNTPARKKFLKSDATELGHVLDTIYGLALGHPDVQFRLMVNGRLHKHFAGTDGLLQRAVNVLGSDLTNKLYPLDFTDGPVTVRGYGSNPMVTRSTSSRLFLFVNQRLVYDRGLISAVFRGYQGRIMKGRYPLGAIFVDIDFNQVDVNVHPAKRQIRFYNPGMVHQAVSGAIRKALACAQEDAKEYASQQNFGMKPQKTGQDSRPVFTEHSRYQGFEHAQVKQAVLSFKEKPSAGTTSFFSAVESDVGAPPAEAPDAGESPATDFPVNEPVSQEMHPVYQPDGEPEFSAAEQGMKSRVIGQMLGTYIVVENGEGMMLVDQHAAHERIVYEQMKKRYEKLENANQMLLVPQILELNHREAEFLNSRLDDLKALGVLVEPFGGNTFAVKSVPAVIEEADIKELLTELVDHLMENKGRVSDADWIDNCLITMACHSSIRARHTLSREEMETLIEDLEKCENKRHCPHGRPILLFWSKDEIEKLFKRVV